MLFLSHFCPHPTMFHPCPIHLSIPMSSCVPSSIAPRPHPQLHPCPIPVPLFLSSVPNHSTSCSHSCPYPISVPISIPILSPSVSFSFTFSSHHCLHPCPHFCPHPYPCYDFVPISVSFLPPSLSHSSPTLVPFLSPFLSPSLSPSPTPHPPPVAVAVAFPRPFPALSFPAAASGIRTETDAEPKPAPEPKPKGRPPSHRPCGPSWAAGTRFVPRAGCGVTASRGPGRWGPPPPKRRQREELPGVPRGNSGGRARKGRARGAGPLGWGRGPRGLKLRRAVSKRSVRYGAGYGVGERDPAPAGGLGGRSSAAQPGIQHGGEADGEGHLRLPQGALLRGHQGPQDRQGARGPPPPYASGWGPGAGG